MPSRAQAQASIEIDPLARGTQDPHPITYLWHGDVPFVREPVQYYTYYYTGTVNADATAPPGVEIRRIPIPNNEWTRHKAPVVAELTAFLRQQTLTGAPTSSPFGQQLEFNENFEYVEVDETTVQNTAGIDPRAAAEWTFYLDQVVLWQFYCRRVLLAERDAERANSDRTSLQEDADRRFLTENFQGVDAGRVLEEFRRQQEPQASPTPAPAGDQTVLTVATEFEPDAIYQDPAWLDLFREEFVQDAELREARAMDLLTQMLVRIERRRDDRDRLERWVAEREQTLIDFARAWDKVYSGQQVSFGESETFYLFSREPLRTVPRDARNIVIGEVVTPQDLLEADGRLKGPQLGAP